MKTTGKGMRCWEYHNCPEPVRRSCPAHLSANCEECWLVTGKICNGGTGEKETIEEKLMECAKCSYYLNVLRHKIV